MKDITIFLCAIFILFFGVNTSAQWQNIGEPGFSEGTAFYTFIACNNDGKAYVAYSDGLYSNPSQLFYSNY